MDLEQIPIPTRKLIRQWRLKSGVFFPVTIVHAIQLTEQNSAGVLEWCGGEKGKGRGLVILVPTLRVIGDANVPGGSSWQNSVTPAKEGDYVVHWDGRFTVVNPDIFELSYDHIKEST